MLIYSHKITARLQYIIGVIFNCIYQVDEIEYTDNLDDFTAYSGVKIAYSFRNPGTGIFIKSSGLLHETGIKIQEIESVQHKRLEAFFKAKGSVFPFDMLAASFYLVTRYEEYLPFEQDQYGRYVHTQSILFKSNLIKKPIVNIWAKDLYEHILEHYPKFECKPPKYSYLCSIDIDNAFAYLHKGIVRQVGAFFKYLILGQNHQFFQQIRVLSNREKDPFDTYKFQLKMIKKYGLKPLYFFLVGDYGYNDKNIPFHNKKYQSLVKLLADYSRVGIHPSYNSNNSEDQLEIEIKRLKNLTNREIENSRQHFLKLSFPTTYRNLLTNDIKNDFTMGYPGTPGFRAGICSAYPFYDLEIEKEMPLKIHPFAVMDAGLNYYMNLNAEQGFEEIKTMIEEVKAVDGQLITLWHNDSLSGQKPWEGWNDVFEKMIQLAVEKPKEL